QGRHAFAAAGLSDERESLATRYGEFEGPHRHIDARFARDLYREIFNPEDRVGSIRAHMCRHCGTFATESSLAFAETVPRLRFMRFMGRKRRLHGSKAFWTASANTFADSTNASRNTNAPKRFHQTMGSRDISSLAASII